MKEFEIIDYIKKQAGETKGASYLPIGDDCSVIKPPKGKLQVTTADSLVDGNHFSSHYFTPQEIGRKSLRVNLSDIASMGAEPPYYAWLTLSLPPDIKEKVLKGIINGFIGDCKKNAVTLAGGNITSSKEFSIHITLTGWGKKGKLLKRSGAKIGDSIFVTGTIGPSTLAYMQFKSGKKPDQPLLKRWANPVPKIEIGRLLAKKGIANACIDISDGIFQDLNHLLKESGKGALIEWERLPVDPKMKKYNPTPKMIGFGEDYELLFTADNSKSKAVKSLTGKITKIGVITKRGLKVVDKNGKELSIKDVGYNHLA